MSEGYSVKFWRFERRGQAVVPVLVQGTTRDSKFHCQRVTETPWSQYQRSTEDEPADWVSYRPETPLEYPFLRGILRKMGLIQRAEEWPVSAPFLMLDQAAFDVHEADKGISEIPPDVVNNYRFLRPEWLAEIAAESEERKAA